MIWLGSRFIVWRQCWFRCESSVINCLKVEESSISFNEMSKQKHSQAVDWYDRCLASHDKLISLSMINVPWGDAGWKEFCKSFSSPFENSAMIHFRRNATIWFRFGWFILSISVEFIHQIKSFIVRRYITACRLYDDSKARPTTIHWELIVVIALV